MHTRLTLVHSVGAHKHKLIIIPILGRHWQCIEPLLYNVQYKYWMLATCLIQCIILCVLLLLCCIAAAIKPKPHHWYGRVFACWLFTIRPSLSLSLFLFHTFSILFFAYTSNFYIASNGGYVMEKLVLNEVEEEKNTLNTKWRTCLKWPWVLCDNTYSPFCIGACVSVRI